MNPQERAALEEQIEELEMQLLESEQDIKRMQQQEKLL